jgi:hypothetical protein
MDDPQSVSPTPSGGEQRRLDRTPGTRHAAGARVTAHAAQGVSVRGVSVRGVSDRGVSVRGIGIAALVASAGGAAFFVLGQLTLGPGLLAVAAFTGWITAVALVDLGGGAGLRPGAGRIALAAGMAGAAILAAILLDWAWAGVQGGVLGPLDYIGERYGPAALLDVGVAGLFAALHAR